MISSVKTLGMLFCMSFLILHLEAQFLDNAVSLGGAPVGVYSRQGLFGDGDNLASLGGAQVGVYRRQQNPAFLYQLARIPVVIPSRFSVDRRPVRPRPRPVRPRPNSVKPSGISGRSGLLGLGLLGGLL
ncbi:uncharacterized protein LOC129972922 [Argiope bruennichi]|uniref:Uncharacterized protein n=1 Tax=Argiope bruennichi TaxID=94029 RepID=A0A8T0F9T1_ARGBR|nr:uncharacterized protein LOC129972922 [Argiope bruennichi]KAF8787152.1 hypothetical protein HNY73_008777 [Argiope bruennichi]